MNTHGAWLEMDSRLRGNDQIEFNLMATDFYTIGIG